MRWGIKVLHVRGLAAAAAVRFRAEESEIRAASLSVIRPRYQLTVEPQPLRLPVGGTENAGRVNDGRQNAGHENAGMK